MMILASDIAKDWGINISQVPVVGCAPEWMSEKAVSIGNYVVATGIDLSLIHIWSTPPAACCCRA